MATKNQKLRKHHAYAAGRISLIRVRSRRISESAIARQRNPPPSDHVTVFATPVNASAILRSGSGQGGDHYRPLYFDALFGIKKLITHQNRVHLQDVILTHAIRLIEVNGPIDDGTALRQAHAKFSGDQDRLLERGRILSRELGLPQELNRWRQLAQFGALVFVVLAYLISGGMVVALAGPDRTINAALALLSILALPSLMLLIWIYSVIKSTFGQFNQGVFSVGKVLLNLVARFPYGRNKHSLYLLSAVQDTLQRNRISVWMFGYYSHVLWAATYLLVLIRLKILFAFQSYRLVWETTDMSLQSFSDFLQITGWLPSQIGFAIPTNLTLNGTPTPDQIGAAASWLIGGTLVYGLLPRILGFVASSVLLKRRLSTVHLDTTDIYFAKLLTRINALDHPKISDPEHPQPRTPSATQPALIGESHVELALVGFELSRDQKWPPNGLTTNAAIYKSISGTIDEIADLQREIAVARPKSILVGFDAAASPDRGAERFLKELQSSTKNIAILMIASNRDGHDNPLRWQQWQKEVISGVTFLANVDDTKKWLQDKNGQSN